MAVPFKVVMTRLILVLCLFARGRESLANAPLSLATFRADVTPDIGEGPCVGSMPRVETIEHPLELRGVVLRTMTGTYVISTIDFCGLCNSSDETIREAMARAAGTTIDRVSLQSLHQHTAPILDADAMLLLHGETSPEFARHQEFTNRVSQRASDAITASITRFRPVTEIHATRTRVERVASNRRVPQPDGSIAVRASLTRELDVREAPEGLIDPWLRTLTFLTGDTTTPERLVQLHYYATHPQTFYGDHRISWDCVGMARERMEKETNVFQIYFTGCAGNVTVGKYNDGTREAREQLASRLYEAMQQSRTATAEKVVDVRSLSAEEISWSSVSVDFTPRETGTFAPELLKRQLAADQAFNTRLTAAMFSAFTQRLRDGHRPQATRMRIGGVDIIHLPGEPFVQFQLFVQENADPGTFPCVAGYGECGVWYYGPDQIFLDRGGYEQSWSLTGPCEAHVKSALKELLKR